MLRLLKWFRKSNTLDSTPKFDIDELPRYPPFAQGFPAASADQVLSTQRPLVNRIKAQMGLDEADTRTYVIDVLSRHASYVHFLPASKDYHHRGAGGLLRHSLEVALEAINMAEHQNLYKSRLNEIDSPAKRAKLHHYWRLCNFYAALLHDIGKPVIDVEVSDREVNHVWSPFDHPMTDWLVQNNIERYFLTYKHGRFGEHEQCGAYLSPLILGNKIYGELRLGNPQAFLDMTNAITKFDSDCQIAKNVVAADQLSLQKDRKEVQHIPALHATSVPIAESAIDIMRSFIESGQWKINQPGARVWYSNDGLFIAWEKGANDIYTVAKRELDIPAFPRSHMSLADTLNANGFVEPYEDDAHNNGRVLTKIAPIMLRRDDGKLIKFEALKLVRPDILIYTQHLPEPVEIVVGTDSIKHVEDPDKRPVEKDFDEGDEVEIVANVEEVEEEPSNQFKEATPKPSVSLDSVVAGFDTSDEPATDESESTDAVLPAAQAAGGDGFDVDALYTDVEEDPFAFGDSNPSDEPVVHEKADTQTNETFELNFDTGEDEQSQFIEPTDNSNVVEGTAKPSDKELHIEDLPAQTSKDAPGSPPDLVVPVDDLVASIENDDLRALAISLLNHTTHTIQVNDEICVVFDPGCEIALESYRSDALDYLRAQRILNSVPGKPMMVVHEAAGTEYLRINPRYALMMEPVLARLNTAPTTDLVPESMHETALDVYDDIDFNDLPTEIDELDLQPDSADVHPSESEVINTEEPTGDSTLATSPVVVATEDIDDLDFASSESDINFDSFDNFTAPALPSEQSNSLRSEPSKTHAVSPDSIIDEPQLPTPSRVDPTSSHDDQAYPPTAEPGNGVPSGATAPRAGNSPRPAKEATRAKADYAQSAPEQAGVTKAKNSQKHTKRPHHSQPGKSEKSSQQSQSQRGARSSVNQERHSKKSTDRHPTKPNTTANPANKKAASDRVRSSCYFDDQGKILIGLLISNFCTDKGVIPDADSPAQILLDDLVTYAAEMPIQYTDGKSPNEATVRLLIKNNKELVEEPFVGANLTLIGARKSYFFNVESTS